MPWREDRAERTEGREKTTVRSATVEAPQSGLLKDAPGLVAIVGVLVVGGVCLRFIAPSPMWLDEAMSASLAEEANRSWSGLVEALRSDGHPPLFYVLLAIWSNLIGTGDAALRAFSGVLGVMALALAWPVARRHLGTRGSAFMLGVVATSPFAIRYSTEVRMYELLLVLLLLGHLAVVRAWEQPRPARLAAVATVVAALLFTHYWALFAVAVLGVSLLVAVSSHSGERSRLRRLLLGVVCGCIAFIPWLPVFLDQLANTGTPWSPAPRPTVVAALTLESYGGGRGSEALLVAAALVALVTLGVGTRSSGWGRPALIGLTNEGWLRIAVGLGIGTMILGSIVSLATDTAFQGRYAVFAVVPMFLATAAGLCRLPARSSLLALLVLALLSGASVARELDRGRTQIGKVSEAVVSEGSSGDIVVFCPDQLAPAGYRLLADRFTVLAYPDLDDGRRVNWRNYEERNAGVDLEGVVDEIVARSLGAKNIWLAWMDGYETFEGQCPALRLALAERLGRPTKIVYADSEAFDDASNLSRFIGPS